MISLYLVPTPIGNIDDMTFRSVKVLNEVDLIFCEDTRNTKVLLAHYNITTPLKSYHIFNEEERVNEIIELLKAGNVIALVSDAGYPGISDPGYLVCKKAIENGFNVSTLPGATASLTALVTSGIPCDKFYFHGFLSHTKSQKIKELEELIDYDKTMIFYESPHRIKETIYAMKEVYKNRNVCIARELTKKYEEYIRFNLKDCDNINLELKGEMVIICEGAKIKSIALELNSLSVLEHYEHYLKETNDSKEAMKKGDRNQAVKVLNDSFNKIWQKVYTLPEM